ncbi:uncharacterized protein Z519_06010 [Cladophialophora bantiana CBS 173.52]|uniref:aldehyde dehydrogenase (NAD(+)) n=1 Tax=Cladophialophora bantiana (strain ATCC 10958 / CBS 173.52 / CDC B-1940 / NIH 8579) TaxID=1442370 RepID=A0A0D2HRD6_CLAB1|nr:uncharacterized protein Z519_06010 [Cladophialophora bantiana CBS 173.52]KIW93405.1 hypothetical protein Z519_06010 [Cladophialophora bantiana CBS 173.52]
MKDDQFYQFYNCIEGGLHSGSQQGRAVDPSTTKELWDVPLATPDDLEKAVKSATNAFPSWSSTKWEERASLLRKAYDVLASKREQMAILLKLETGKPLRFARLEVEHSLGWLNYHANLGPISPRILQDDEEFQLAIHRVPVGVVAAICPWNYPLVLAMGKICASLSTGNCVIVKPSPFTPYSVVKFVELVQGLFPPGVIQALNGDDRLGPWMCQHTGIQKISFTGSIKTGKAIMAAAAPTLKRLTLELGGNGASIICPDVDISKTAVQVAIGSFTNSGQYCLASKRLYVHESIYDTFLKDFVNEVKSWNTDEKENGDSMSLGPVQNAMQYEIVRGFIRDCRDKGYHFALGGDTGTQSSFMLKPTVVDNPPDDSAIVKEEPFGPIVPVMKWKTEEEVIRRVNNTNTGLGGAVWSSDVRKAFTLAERVQAGAVWINGFERPLPHAHLAGHKESGLGGEWGEEGLFSYTEPKTFHWYKK